MGRTHRNVVSTAGALRTCDGGITWLDDYWMDWVTFGLGIEPSWDERTAVTVDYGADFIDTLGWAAGIDG